MSSVLVVCAHASDFVWRAAGVLARTVEDGGTAAVLALSYGERGESGELWKQPNQTEDDVKRIRHDEGARAAAAVGAEFACLGLPDYPLLAGQDVVDRVAAVIRERRPDVLITHTPADPFNPDHPVAHDVALLARQLCAGAGVASAFETIAPPRLYFFEPHQPELSGFVPNVFADVTPVFAKKLSAMSAMSSQTYLQKYYAERAEHRANHARRVSGDGAVKYAEAFQRALPHVVSAL